MSRVRLRVGVEASAYSVVRGGITRYIEGMAAEMLSLDPGVEFVFYAPCAVDIQLPPGRWRLRVSGGGRHSIGSLWIQRQVPAWAAEDKVDVLWGQNHMLPLHARHRCFRVLTVHDVAPFVCPQAIGLRSLLVRKLYSARACRAADVIVADSDATARDIVRLFGIRREKVRRVYLGADERFRPVSSPVARMQVIQKYGLPREYMLTVGTIEPRKSHSVLLDALRLAPGAPMLAIVGGVGWKATPIVEQIGVMEKAGRVRYLGRIDDRDLPALYSAATLMIFPSLYEGFGLPVLEAMACGCPVLCSWSSSLPELGGDAVRYFRPGDSADLALGLAALLQGERQRAGMSAAGLQRAGRFSLRKAARETLDIMRQGGASIR